MNLVSVVGLGMSPADLSPAVLEAMADAEVLAGGRRLLDFFPDHPGGRLPLTGKVELWLEQVAQAAQAHRVAVLASGDPGFYGIAARVIQRLGAQWVRVLPNITAVQAAFARLKLPWQEARIISLHGRGPAALFSAVAHCDLVAAYSDHTHTPGRMAAMLLRRGQEGWRMHVAENLGAPDERVSTHALSEAVGGNFSALNLVVLERTHRPESLCLGLPEEAYEHSQGLITKAEVRAVALAKLRLRPHHLLWDLGAGCGSLGLEASGLLWQGAVVAVERDAERAEMIRRNRARYGAANLEVVHGEMPAVLPKLPRPDRVFVGGAGPALEDVLDQALLRLPAAGVVVVAAIQLDTVQRARRKLAAAGLGHEVVQVQINRGAPLAADLYLRALNPVWLISATKETP